MSTAKQMSMGHSTPEVTPEATVTPEVTLEATPAASHLTVTALPATVVQASQPVFNWWVHHWMDASHPLTRLQRAWMESVLEAIEVEAEFLNACALSNAKVWNCLTDTGLLTDSASLHSRYHEVAKDMTDAHLTRFGRVAELSEDFKQRLWEEM